MEIVTLSIGRNILKSGSRDRLRMALYARHMDAFHIVVLTRRTHGYSEVVHEGNLHLYPTNSRSRLMMLIDAFRSTVGILRNGNTHVRTLTAQDPLELGVLSYLTSKYTKTPYTVQVHGDYYSDAWTEGSITRRLRRRVIPFVLRHAQKVRVVSERIRASLIRIGVPDTKIHVLPIRPELDVFRTAGEHKQLPEAFTVLTASRLAPEKNIPLLIHAFALLHKKYPEVRLRIAGEGEEQSRIETCIKRLRLEDAVTLIPWTHSIAYEMANAHVFALASLHEAYSLVLIEALATGTPVVTTDVGCVGEVVQDGVHGIVVPVGDEVAFGAALTRMYEAPRFRSEAGLNGCALREALARVSEDTYAKEWVSCHSL